jgi:transposase-like protein
MSKSQVSVMAKDLDAQVEAFRTRPLDVAGTGSSSPMR